MMYSNKFDNPQVSFTYSKPQQSRSSFSQQMTPIKGHPRVMVATDSAHHHVHSHMPPQHHIPQHHLGPEVHKPGILRSILNSFVMYDK